MGEIAEMMLDGTLCEGCGAYLQSEGRGLPRRCRDCKRSDREQQEHPPVKPGSNKTACKTCGRRVKLAGIHDHMRDAHNQGKAQR
ncbi:MAG: hypothetical protein N2483_07470 [Burkholderiaceae bacterium]|nr:hypothetical protein [Burkholderiaceae bacterium]